MIVLGYFRLNEHCVLRGAALREAVVIWKLEGNDDLTLLAAVLILSKHLQHLLSHVTHHQLELIRLQELLYCLIRVSILSNHLIDSIHHRVKQIAIPLLLCEL